MNAAVWALVGALFGIVASVLAWRYILWATEPSLELNDLPPGTKRQSGDQHPTGPHEFYHVLVRHRPPLWPFNSRSPAWATRATIEVVGDDGEPLFDPITARWPSQPEPVKDVLRNGIAENVLDPTLISVGQRADVHFHESTANRVWINIAVKFEGQAHFFMFSNESYLHNWCNPDWRLDGRMYRMKVRLFYETGVTARTFTIENGGDSRDDFRIAAE